MTALKIKINRRKVFEANKVARDDRGARVAASVHFGESLTTEGTGAEKEEGKLAVSHDEMAFRHLIRRFPDTSFGIPLGRIRNSQSRRGLKRRCGEETHAFVLRSGIPCFSTSPDRSRHPSD